MPQSFKSERALAARLYRSMSNQLCANNAAILPARYNVPHNEAAGFLDIQLVFVAIEVNKLLENDNHEVDVQCMPLDGGPYAYQFVSSLLEEEQ